MAWGSIAGRPFPDALEDVVESEAWRDQREDYYAVQCAFWEAMREVADEYEEFPDGTVRATFDLTKEKDELEASRVTCHD